MKLFKTMVITLLAIASLMIALPHTLPAHAEMLSFSHAQLKGRDFTNRDLAGSGFANANMEGANFANADLRGSVLSASILRNANLQGVNLTGALLDQTDFAKANLSDALMMETLLLRSTFDYVNIDGADFTDAILDGAQRKWLCSKAKGVNSRTGVSTRDSLECK
ncbi:MAG: pentapeptide repeat-containing protein [Pseudanabaenaceae cyanobacterium bins.39]|nr:pentapeptide repeat-containing protein [Pseudanabaenaceae cyanobacterium bins.39]